jgi:tol-pal system protein YbgF
VRLRFLLLAGLCAVVGQARAGLFNDDEARMQVRQVDERVSKLEESGKQQAEAIGQQLAETSKQQTRSLLDLQAQIEAQNGELRNLRGQNEELKHLLQDAEKRQKDFYIDLDTRIRHFESIEAANAAEPAPPPTTDKPADAASAADDIAVENRAYEAAYALFKAGNHQKAAGALQEFLKKFPDSVHAPKASYELGSAHFALKDFKSALASYQTVAGGKYSFSPKAQDAMLGVADCQQELNDSAAAKKTLKQIVAKYPGSGVADKAKERLAVLK